MGWQATVAVLAVDGLLVGAVFAVAKPTRSLGFLPILGATLTLLMALQTLKWMSRTNGRVSRLKQYDRMHGFGRFYSDETAFLRSSLGLALFGLMIITVIGLVVFAIFLFSAIPLP
jgi:hypothetical protein